MNNNKSNNNNRIERRDLRSFTISDPHCAANRLQHIRSSGPGAIVCKSRAAHGALIMRNISCATWYEGTAQLLSLTELKSQLFELYFIAWTINRMKEGRNPEYPEKTPEDELQKIPWLSLKVLTFDLRASEISYFEVT